MCDDDWAASAVRKLVVRALLCAASLYERLAELEMRK